MERKPNIYCIGMLDTKFESVRNGDGIAFSVPVSSVIGVAVYQFLIDNRKRKEQR